MLEPFHIRRARLLKARIGQAAWRTEYPEEFPVIIRPMDYNGFSPDDDGDTTAAEAGIVSDAEDFLAFMAEHTEKYRLVIEGIRARDAMVREELARLEKDGGFAV